MNEKTGRFLVCHETLGRFWSLPKGVMDAGDRDMACAACRELREETGIVLEPHDLQFLGKYEYRDVKDLAVFIYHAPDAEAEYELPRLRCESRFERRYSTKSGEQRSSMLPEIDRYRFINAEEAQRIMNKRQAEIVSEALDSVS